MEMLLVMGKFILRVANVNTLLLSSDLPVLFGIYTNLKIASGMMSRLSLALQRFEQAIQTIFGRGFPPGN